MRAFAQQLQSLENVSWNEEIWVIFDNTALGHGTANAVWMTDALRGSTFDRICSAPRLGDVPVG
jgi:hypothetical protein